MLLSTLIFCCLSAASSSGVNYDGYELWNVTPTTDEHVKILLKEDLEAIVTVGKTFTVLVPPLSSLRKVIPDSIIPFTVHVKHLQQHIEESGKFLPYQTSPDGRYALTWDNYYSVLTIFDFLRALAATHPDIVTTSVIGRGSDGRSVMLVKVSLNDNVQRPGIFIEAGLHAREWITVTSATFFLRELVENRIVNQDLLEAADWHVLAVANPDGYEHSGVTDRMWKKTRKISPVIPNCLGADADRNFDMLWGEIGTTTTMPCSEYFAGETAFSEPETSAIRDYVTSTTGIVAYVAVHSYSQAWMYPWGWTTDEISRQDELRSIAMDAAASMSAVNGRFYDVGAIADFVQLGSGMSTDWAYGTAKIPYAYTLELPGPDFWYNVPKTEIEPIGYEFLEGMRTFSKRIKDLTM